jgi:hypothetical protein
MVDVVQETDPYRIQSLGNVGRLGELLLAGYDLKV